LFEGGLILLSKRKIVPKERDVNLTICLIGPSRCGKSSFINLMCLQEVAERSVGPAPKTFDITGYKCSYVNYNTILWVDTPGFKSSETMVIKNNWMKSLKNLSKLTRANILLIFNDYTIIEERLRMVLESIKADMVPDIWSNIYIVLTGDIMIDKRDNEFFYNMVKGFKQGLADQTGIDVSMIKNDHFVIFPRVFYELFENLPSQERFNNPKLNSWIGNMLSLFNTHNSAQLFCHNWRCFGRNFMSIDSEFDKNECSLL